MILIGSVYVKPMFKHNVDFCETSLRIMQLILNEMVNLEKKYNTEKPVET